MDQIWTKPKQLEAERGSSQAPDLNPPTLSQEFAAPSLPPRPENYRQDGLTEQTSSDEEQPLLQRLLTRPTTSASKRAIEIIKQEGSSEAAEQIISRCSELPLSELSDPKLRENLVSEVLFLDPLSLLPKGYHSSSSKEPDSEVAKLVQSMRHQGFTAQQIAVQFLDSKSPIYNLAN